MKTSETTATPSWRNLRQKSAVGERATMSPFDGRAAALRRRGRRVRAAAGAILAAPQANRKEQHVESSALRPTPDPMRHHKHYTDSRHGRSPYAGGSSFMERVAEAVAS